MSNTKITSAVIKDANILTAAIADAAVTSAKIADDVALAGNPTAGTQTAGNNSTRLATTAYTDAAVTALVDSSPSTLNTLNELAAALGDDVNFSTTVTDSIALKAPLASPTFTGTVTATGTGDADTGITTTHSRSGVGFTLALNNTNNGANKGSGIKWKSGGFTTGAIITRSDAIAASADAPAYMTFHTSSDGTENLTERLRLSSSGNVLVGTTQANPTSSGVNVAGQEFSTTGGVRSTVASNAAATFNRKTNDGGIVLFRKDGATVGSIGTYFGDLFIASPSSTDAGLGFGASKISPVTTTGAPRDNAIDLGASAARFKDLYLSGEAKVTSTGVDGTYVPILRGVYSGNANETNTIETAVSSGAGNSGFKFNVSNGGGSSGQTEGLRITRSGTYAPLGIKLGSNSAANKLEDFEFGTWTAVHGGQNMATAGRYTKVGQMVTLVLDATAHASATSSSSISGLPFTVTSSNSAFHVGWTTSAAGLTGGYCSLNNNKLQFTVEGAATGQNLAAGERVMLTATYVTTT